MVTWTEEQKQTIEERGRNILVSAAAGSGKTTVMVERIKQLVLREKEDVDGFLITTFTTAAASDMKKKLEKSIRDELKSRALGDPDRSFLLRQLYLLPSASISTFHAFAGGIIRDYFYLTDLEPGFTVGDEVETAIMEKEAIDSVFEKHYENREDEDFRAFLMRRSSDRNDRNLKDTLVSTYKKIRSVPDYFDWAYTMAGKLDREAPAEELGLSEFISRERDRSVEQAIEYMKEAAGLTDSTLMPAMNQKILEDAALLEAARGMDEEDFAAFAAKPGFAVMRAPKEEKAHWEAVKDEVKDLRDLSKKCLSRLSESYYSDDREVLEEELHLVYADTVYFIDLMKEFEDELRARKSSKNIIDFDDVMHYALDILRDEKAAGELREKYRYIFIDEYQDSNFLQEAIISRIARPDNLFMVGDVKQSIYRFRLAEPGIFIRTAENYRRVENEKSLVIDLNSNFRSRENVTEAVNRVFRGVMPGYGEVDELHCTRGLSDYKTRLHIIDSEALREEDREKLETEGAVAVNIIRECLEAGFSYRDIAVLSRGGNAVGELENLLMNEGIPAYGENDEGYFESVEIQVFINFLRVTDNMRRDVPLASVMRSVLYNFTFNEMAHIRGEFPEGSFCEAVRAYGEEGRDETLKNKVRDFLSSLEYWRELAGTMALDDFVKRMLYDTGYYDYCSSLPVGRQRVSNLRLIVEKASAYEKMNHRGLSGFLRYIDAMAGAGLNVAPGKTLGENEDVVRIMTIHKSKGLEFPVVILIGAGRKTGGSRGETVAMHKDFGLGLDYVDRENRIKKPTLLQKVIAGRKAEENLDEEVRVLYVAMTRAEERLEIVGTVKADSLKETQRKDSYISMIYPALKDMDEAEVITYTGPPEQITAEKRRLSLMGLMAKADNPPDSERGRAAAERLSFVYPYEDKGVRTKYSVSMLNSQGSREIPLAQFNPERKKGGLTPAERGTVMHKVMERIDFTRAAEEGGAYVEAFADEMLEKGILTGKERGVVKSGKIAAFFSGEPGRRAAVAYAEGRLHREQEFIMRKEIDGTPAIVQGIIDCFFREGDRMVLIDYKNTVTFGDASEEEIRERYRSQIELYREALEKAEGVPVIEAYIYVFGSEKFMDMN